MSSIVLLTYQTILDRTYLAYRGLLFWDLVPEEVEHVPSGVRVHEKVVIRGVLHHNATPRDTRRTARRNTTRHKACHDISAVGRSGGQAVVCSFGYSSLHILFT